MDAGTLYQIKTGELRTEPPFSELFAVKPETTQRVTASMKANGYDQAYPIVAWNGVVVDGHTRLKCAKAAKLDRVPVVYRQFLNESEALEYAIACQRNRRNLTPDEMLRCLAELDKRKARGGDHKSEESKAQDCAIDRGKSAEATAELLGISTRQAEQLRTIADHAPDEVRTALAHGDLSVNAAYRATQQARNPQPHTEPPLEPTAPDAPTVTRYRAELWQVASSRPREDWPAIADAMREVIDMLEAP